MVRPRVVLRRLIHNNKTHIDFSQEMSFSNQSLKKVTATRLSRLISTSRAQTPLASLFTSPTCVFSTTSRPALTSPVLKDSFGRHHNYLRISLTEKCNLRCTYCMPADGIQLTPRDELLTTDELLQIAHTFIDEGVTKIRFTGGEPSLRSDLADIIANIAQYRSPRKALERVSVTSPTSTLLSPPSHSSPFFRGVDTIGMTSNGLVLTVGNRLRRYVDAGLTSLNLSLDTLDPLRFQIISRRDGLHKVLDSLHLALELGVKTKINCVVRRGINDDEVHTIAALARELPIQVRFIEYMPFDGNKWDPKRLVSSFEMIDKIQLSLEHELASSTHKQEEGLTSFPSRFKSPQLIIRDVSLDEKDRVARMYRVEGYRGSVGFISSMTNSFCSSCNRLRLTADGNLKVCLFGEEEVSLRDIIRGKSRIGDPTAEANYEPSKYDQDASSPLGTVLSSQRDLREVIQMAVWQKKESHAAAEILAQSKNRPMITIGG